MVSPGWRANSTRVAKPGREPEGLPVEEDEPLGDVYPKSPNLKDGWSRVAVDAHEGLHRLHYLDRSSGRDDIPIHDPGIRRGAKLARRADQEYRDLPVAELPDDAGAVGHACSHIGHLGAPSGPSFITFRERDGEILVGVLDPHNPDLDDAVPKAKGMAEYAAQHHNLFDCFELLILEDDQFKRLDLKSEAIRSRVLAVVTNTQLRHLFDELG